MFTVEQIKAAHSKVKTGADFPAYIKEIRTFKAPTFSTHQFGTRKYPPAFIG